MFSPLEECMNSRSLLCNLWPPHPNALQCVCTVSCVLHAWDPTASWLALIWGIVDGILLAAWISHKNIENTSFAEIFVYSRQGAQSVIVIILRQNLMEIRLQKSEIIDSPLEVMVLFPPASSIWQARTCARAASQTSAWFPVEDAQTSLTGDLVMNL